MKAAKGKKKALVGEVVLVGEDGVKRNRWKMGRIEKLIKGKDGVIRGASIRTKNGTVGRPLQKIYPLEVVDDGDNTRNDNSGVNEVMIPDASNDPDHVTIESDYVDYDDDDDTTSIPTNFYATSSNLRPKRAAGAVGEEKRRIQSRASLGNML